MWKMPLRGQDNLHIWLGREYARIPFLTYFSLLVFLDIFVSTTPPPLASISLSVSDTGRATTPKSGLPCAFWKIILQARVVPLTPPYPAHLPRARADLHGLYPWPAPPPASGWVQHHIGLKSWGVALRPDNAVGLPDAICFLVFSPASVYRCEMRSSVFQTDFKLTV